MFNKIILAGNLTREVFEWKRFWNCWTAI